jgi:hypothetical protein
VQARSVGSRRAPRKITPEQALENTNTLLKAKQARARATPPWRALGSNAGAVPAPEFQSDEARVQATTLHKAEMDLDAIQGDISSRDRRKQGKRDSR